jgi:hypothetical protein
MLLEPVTGTGVFVTMTKDNLDSRIKKPSFLSDVAKSNTGKLCGCPNSEPGKINLDVCSHQRHRTISQEIQ